MVMGRRPTLHHESRIEQLKKLLADTKKLKADDFVKVFSAPAGGDVK
jgi:hypothetical protein